jgi:hypothetical protein
MWRQVIRNRHRARTKTLSIEALEARDLLSTTPGAVITSGLLQAGSTVFDLHTDGRLFRQNPNGGETYLDGSIQMITVASDGSVFDLHTDGGLYLQNADGTWRYLDAGVQNIAGTNSPDVFDLHTDGRLFLQNAGGAWRYLDGVPLTVMSLTFWAEIR